MLGTQPRSTGNRHHQAPAECGWKSRERVESGSQRAVGALQGSWWRNCRSRGLQVEGGSGCLCFAIAVSLDELALWGPHLFPQLAGWEPRHQLTFHEWKQLRLKLHSLQARLCSKAMPVLTNLILRTNREIGIFLLGIAGNTKMCQVCSLTLIKEYRMQEQK